MSLLPSNISVPGLPTAPRRPASFARLRPDGTGAVQLTTVSNPSSGCEVKLVRPEQPPDDISHLVVLDSVGSDIKFSLLFISRDDVLPPGLYTVDYAVGTEVQGRCTFLVEESSLNPRSLQYKEERHPGAWRWSEVIDIPLRGQSIITVALPGVYDNLAGGMGFCLRLNGAVDMSATVTVQDRTPTTVTLACSPVRAGHVLRCIFY